MGLFSKKKPEASAPATTNDLSDPNRAALFGKAAKNAPPPAPPAKNPYATGPVADRNGYGYDSKPQGGNASYGGGYGDDRRAPASNGNGRDASAGGYGGARPPPPSGGFGAGPRPAASRTASAPVMDQEAGKRALFGGAQERAQRQPPPPNSFGAGPRPGFNRAQSASTVDTDPGKRELFNGAKERAQQREAAGSYGRERQDQGDRQQSPEDDEEEDVEAIRQEIRFVKQESVASTRNALRAAVAAEESGRDSLARLGAQGERLYNTEKNLNLAESANRTAAEQARELKSLNRSMFAVHVKNPFNSTARNKERDQVTLDRFEMEKAQRDATRQFGYESKSHVDNALKGQQGGGYGRSQRSMAERQKYQFEADESDEEKEREIEDNLDEISAVTSRLRGLAMATGKELEDQNLQIQGIKNQSDTVHGLVHLNTKRIERIR